MILCQVKQPVHQRIASRATQIAWLLLCSGGCHGCGQIVVVVEFSSCLSSLTRCSIVTSWDLCFKHWPQHCTWGPFCMRSILCRGSMCPMLPTNHMARGARKRVFLEGLADHFWWLSVSVIRQHGTTSCGMTPVELCGMIDCLQMPPIHCKLLHGLQTVSPASIFPRTCQ